MKQATKFLVALAMVLLPQVASAQSTLLAGASGDWKDGDVFTAKTVEGIEMKFKVLSAKNHTCQVGWQLSSQELENGVFDDYIAIDPKTTGAITIPSVVNGLQVLGISHGAFAECEGITSVVIPEGSTFIGAMAFYGCKSLASVNMPESLISIGYNTEYKESWYCEDYVFGYCNSLTSITIPKNVSIFGRFLFEGSDKITTIYSQNENPSDAGTAFHEDPRTIGKICSNATLYVPMGSKEKYQIAGGWKNFKKIEEYGDNPEPQLTSAYLSIDPFNIKAGETNEMMIDLTNPEDEITLVQFDLRLPEGLSLKQVGGEYDIDMCDRTTWRKHSLDANATDGIIRFLLASSSNTVISDSKGTIIKMTLVADNSYQSGEIKLEKILLVTPDEKEIKPADVVYKPGDSSGIEQISTVLKGYNTVYSLSGQRISVPRKGINIISGRKMVVK